MSAKFQNYTSLILALSEMHVKLDHPMPMLLIMSGNWYTKQTYLVKVYLIAHSSPFPKTNPNIILTSI